MSSTEEILNNIGEKKYRKPILSLREFPLNEPLQIEKCERKLTLYGIRIMLELEHQVIFLPDKYTYISDATIMDLSTGEYLITKITNNGIYYKFIFNKKSNKNNFYN